MSPRGRHHEWWEDGQAYELVDLPHGRSLVLMPTEEDLENARPRNPKACALAQCAIRQSSGLPALIGIDKAYIPMLNDRGRWVMYRCNVPARTERAIHEFDRTHVFPEGGFVFTGIPPSATLNAQRANGRRYRANRTPGPRKSRPRVHLRNAARAAQVFVRDNGR